jgi:hypothetical protein
MESSRMKTWLDRLAKKVVPAILISSWLIPQAHADKTITVAATPTANSGYTNVTVTATITPWSSGDSGSINFSDNGLTFENAVVPNSSGGIISIVVTNIYPGNHNFIANYKGVHGVPASGNLSGTFGTVILSVPPAGSDYIGAWLGTSSGGIGPTDIAALEQGNGSGIGRQLSVHLEYSGWTNDPTQLWTDLSAANPAPIDRFNVLASGSGYTAPPDVLIVPVGNGSGAAASATLSSGGGLASITVSSSGSGYTTAPSVTFTGGGGLGAIATSTISAGGVTSISVASPGFGFTSAPTVVLTPVAYGMGATGSVTVGPSNTITAISLVSGGSGYINVPAVQITGGGGKNAEATATISGGVVTGLTLTGNGSGYTYPMLTASVSGDGGSGAVASVSDNVYLGGVVKVSVVDVGSGYTSPPNVELLGGGGTGAGAQATVGSAGTIIGITVVEGGSGYTTPPAITIGGGGGAGATATATVTGGVVTAINVNAPGSGYVYPALNVTVSGGGGSGAAATSVAAARGYYIGYDLAKGRIPMISWGCGNCYSIAAGEDNAYIDAIAAGLVSIAGSYPGKPILLRWCWEMNLSHSQDLFMSTDPPTQQSDFIAAWQFLVNRIRYDFHTAGVSSNVIFVFNPGTNLQNQTDSVGRLFYPGDQWVDWIALDDYNVTQPYVSDFQMNPGIVSMVPANSDEFGFYPIYTNTSTYLGMPTYPAIGYDKPLMIGENGTGTCGTPKDSGCVSPSSSDLQATYLGTVQSELPTSFP